MVGVDIGGTNVRAMSLYEDGTPAGPRVEIPSRAQEGAATTLDAIADAMRQAAAGSERPPLRAGLAIPGHIDDENGMVRWAPNFGETIDGVFRHWLDVPMREELAKRIELPVGMGNDANLAALGEYMYGSGRGEASCLVMLTLGTGIGGGVVLAPRALQGDCRTPAVLLGGNKGGAELGHLAILHGGLDCNAGSYGSVEAYCQRDGIVRRAQHKIKRDRPSRILDLAQGNLAAITPRHIGEAALDGDEVAIEVLEEVGEYLGVAIGSCINVFAPEVVAIGGQIAKAGDFLMASARRSARNTAIPTLFRDARIVQAEHLEDAGILGAAALAFQGCA